MIKQNIIAWTLETNTEHHRKTLSKKEQMFLHMLECVKKLDDYGLSIFEILILHST